MAQDSVEKIIGRLITDDSFRQRAMLSLQRGCLEEGYVLSKEEETFLMNVLRQKTFNKKIVNISELIDDNLKRKNMQTRKAGEEVVKYAQEILACNFVGEAQ